MVKLTRAVLLTVPQVMLDATSSLGRPIEYVEPLHCFFIS